MTTRSLAVALFLPIGPLAGQQTSADTAQIAPVVVTATRTPQILTNLPFAVSVITARELELRGITSVAEALRDVSSAYVAQAGSQGSQSSLFLRGGESKYVKVLVDGVPTNEPGGAYDFASLTTDNVERIEVVKGPVSVVHGADAVTGVVNVITKRGSGPPRVNLEVRAGIAPREQAGAEPGDQKLLDVSATLGGTLTNASYSFGVARHQTNGLYDLNNDYLNNVLSGRFVLSPADATELRFSTRYSDYQYNYPTNGSGAVVDQNAYRTEDRTVLGAEIEHAFPRFVRAVLALSSSVNNGGTDDGLDSPTGSSYVSMDKSRRRGADLRVHATPLRWSAWTVGASIEQQDQRSQSQSQSSFGPFYSNFEAARQNRAGYLEAVLTPVEQFTATLGGRIDDNEQFGTFGTGRAGVSWTFLPSTRLRGSVGNAFREPTFNENYSTGFVTGNPELRPERTFSWEIGIEQQLFSGRARIGATYFDQRFTNMIDYEPAGTACGFSYCNVAEATASGVEVEADANIGPGFSAGIGATFLMTEVQEPGYDVSSGGLYRAGESLIRRPDRNVTADVSYGRGPLTASVRLIAMGIRRDRNFGAFPAEPVVLESYERVDLGVEYVVPVARLHRAALTLRVENLTNEFYQNVYNFRAPRRIIELGGRVTR